MTSCGIDDQKSTRLRSQVQVSSGNDRTLDKDQRLTRPVSVGAIGLISWRRRPILFRLRLLNLVVMLGSLVVMLGQVLVPSAADALTCHPESHRVKVIFETEPIPPAGRFACVPDNLSWEGIETFDDILATTGFHRGHADVLRLYEAFFGREADVDGARYWLTLSDRYREDGIDPVPLIAQWFVGSPEFGLVLSETIYNGGSTRDFVEWAYTHILLRNSEPVGSTFWADSLDVGRFTSGQMVTWFAQGDEFKSDHLFWPLTSDGEIDTDYPIGI